MLTFDLRVLTIDLRMLTLDLRMFSAERSKMTQINGHRSPKNGDHWSA